MDNPKRSNQAKFNRSKKNKESAKKYIPPSDGAKNSKQNARKNYKDTSPARSKSPVRATSTSQNTAHTSGTSGAYKPKLKKETEEIVNITQKYKKRTIVSNWTRDFDIPKFVGEEEEEGANFQDLLDNATSNFVGSRFMLKEEQEWLAKSESCDSPFSLDLKRLETGVSSIPFYRLLDLPENSFPSKDVQAMNDDAVTGEASYKKLQSNSNNHQKATLKNSEQSIKGETLKNPDPLTCTKEKIDNSLIVNNSATEVSKVTDRKCSDEEINVDNLLLTESSSSGFEPRSQRINSRTNVNTLDKGEPLTSQVQTIATNTSNPLKEIETFVENNSRTEVSNSVEQKIEAGNVLDISNFSGTDIIIENNLKEKLITQLDDPIEIPKTILNMNNCEMKYPVTKNAKSIDDLDYLLGLTDPMVTSSLSTVTDSTSHLSNLSILQQRLEGSGSTLKSKSPISEPEKKENKAVIEEDLDEWLTSILEK